MGPDESGPECHQGEPRFSIPQLAQLLIQVREGVLQELSEPRVRTRFHLVQYFLPRETETLFFPEESGFLPAHLWTARARLFPCLSLLRFHRFAFPPSCHSLIIVLPSSRDCPVARRSLEGESRSEGQFAEIIDESPVLRQVLDQIATVAPSDATVLIPGETGTGKELVACAIHRMSTRKDEILVKVNCTAIPTGLRESELFGHEKGAFTGAVTQKVGRMELAHGGTLFLDEVGEIPLELQPKLLRVLQAHNDTRAHARALLASAHHLCGVSSASTLPGKPKRSSSPGE